MGRMGTEMLTNEAGEVTSHLQGMFTRTIRLLEAGLKPVYVFDGQLPDLKKSVTQRRQMLLRIYKKPWRYFSLVTHGVISFLLLFHHYRKLRCYCFYY
ncbi:hypothetical protein V6Z12_D06G176600 [Gossypium hirsutum]|uniref:Flap endonuclease 1 n=2 Tax=Gossypium TaxID=3633 RepID=A0ABM3AB53_GOSHI|nr:flap endonuclease 1-like [Gossypium hirsutum]TYH67521.1 hypothetical protein ES332_D06G193000v1 [Gossypium tomentosum]